MAADHLRRLDKLKQYSLWDLRANCPVPLDLCSCEASSNEVLHGHELRACPTAAPRHDHVGLAKRCNAMRQVLSAMVPDES
jgi:hypothetical protein